MANCSLSKNILKGCKLFDGGINDKVILIKKSDVSQISYKGEDSEDPNFIGIESLIVTNIDYSDYKEINLSDVTYTNSRNGKLIEHSLKGKIYEHSSELNSLLRETKEDLYLVLFKCNSDNYYKAFGIEFGSKLNYNQNINSEEAYWEIEFTELSKFPLFSVDSYTFSDDKIFDIIYIPSYFTLGPIPTVSDRLICELNEDGDKTGYTISTTASARNYLGVPLDINGRPVTSDYSTGRNAILRLVEEDGGYSESYWEETYDYDVVGTYIKTDIINDKPVRVYDDSVCSNEITGSIELNQNEINIDTTENLSYTLQLTSTSNWSIDTETLNYCNISPLYGNSGTTNIVISGAKGGVDNIRFKNLETKEIINLTVNSYVIKVKSEWNILSDTTVVDIPITALGGDNGFSVEQIDECDNIEYEQVESTLHIIITEPFAEDTTVNFEVTHSDWVSETKTISLNFKSPGDLDPHWVLIAEFCELEN